MHSNHCFIAGGDILYWYTLSPKAECWTKTQSSLYIFLSLWQNSWQLGSWHWRSWTASTVSISARYQDPVSSNYLVFFFSLDKNKKTQLQEWIHTHTQQEVKHRQNRALQYGDLHVHTNQGFLQGQTKVRDEVIQGYIKHRFSGQVKIKQVCIVPTTWRKETSTRESGEKSILGTREEALEDNAVSCSHEPNMVLFMDKWCKD